MLVTVAITVYSYFNLYNVMYLFRCSGITVDKSGVVYVSDTNNHRLQLF